MRRALSTPSRAACVGALLLIATACGDAAETGGGELSAAPLECDDCPITLHPIATLADTTGERLAMHVQVAEHDGEWLVGRVGRQESQFARFATDGVFLGMRGEPGEGPGEFRYVDGFAVHPSGRGLAVLHDEVTALSPAFEVQRTLRDARFTSAFRIVPMADGWVVNSYRGGPPLIFLDSLLTVRAQAGTAALDPDSNQYVMAPARSGGIWAARNAYAYELSRYSADGTPAMAPVAPARAWFAPWSAVPRSEAANAGFPRPNPRVIALREREDGTLLVLIYVADADFAPQPAGGGVPDDSEVENLIDTIIEVVDPRTGAALSSRRVDELLVGFTPQGRLWRPRLRGNAVEIELFEVRVR